MTDFRSQKKQMRQEMQRRREQASAENPRASLMLRDQFFDSVDFAPCAVGYYKAVAAELDPAPLADALRRHGCALALPAVVDKGRPLRFHLYEDGDDLMINSFGIYEPLPTARVVEPDLLLVPLLAFDRRLHRLGYGGGFYDRTLTDLRGRKRIQAIGLGFARQLVDAVPVEPHDVRLDKVVTEIQLFED